MSDSVDKKFEKVDVKMDAIIERIHSIDKTLSRNTDSLEYHVKRTDLLEKQVEPVVRHVWWVNGTLKILGAIATVVAILSGISRLI
jgi:hypothetical protein